VEEWYNSNVPKVLNIKNEEAYRLASVLARLKGEKITQTVLISLRERLERETSGGRTSLAERIMAIAGRLELEPTVDSRTPDEIIGYDEWGVPK